MFTKTLLAAALRLSPWYGETETDEERLARLETIAQAINDATLFAVCAKDARPLPPLPGEAKEEEGQPCTPVWRGDARQLAFLLLTQAYFETRLARHVHEGRCRVSQGECDSGRATSLWQLQAGGHLPKERWEKLSGADRAATTHAAFEATRALSRGRNHCGNLSGAISLYATGRTCKWQPAQERVAFLERLARN
jgi:hypothetical protein